MNIEIEPEDFSDWDRDEPVLAGNDIMRELHDMTYHAYNQGEGWTPFCDEADTPAVIAEARGYIERLEAVMKKAKADIASVERPRTAASRPRRRSERPRDRPLRRRHADGPGRPGGHRRWLRAVVRGPVRLGHRARPTRLEGRRLPARGRPVHRGRRARPVPARHRRAPAAPLVHGVARPARARPGRRVGVVRVAHDFATQADGTAGFAASFEDVATSAQVEGNTPAEGIDDRALAEAMEDTPPALLAWLKGEDEVRVPVASDPEQVRAADVFADEVRRGKVPGIRPIKRRLRIGGPVRPVR